MRFASLWRTAAGLAMLVAAVSACGDDATGVGPGAGAETAVVLNSIDLSLTVFPVDTPGDARTLGLGPAGSPVSLAVRGNLAIVPLGFLAAAARVDLATGAVSSVPLPPNSGATGADFLNDSIAYLANPNLNSVSVIDVAAGTAGPEIPVGVFPQAVIATGGRVFVLNAELDPNFQPARPGLISVIDPATNTVADTISLSGFNPAAAAIGPDGLLYVVNSGSFGQANGTLSVVNPATLAEVEHHAGFGEFPGDIAFGADGNAYVSSFGYGIAVWDAAADTFIRPPSDPLVVGGQSTSSGLGFDSAGRLYTLIPGDCVAPSVLLRTGDPAAEEIGAGVCPIDIAFTRLEGP